MRHVGLLRGAALAILASGCGPGQLPTVYGFVPGDAALSTLDVTDAVVGSTGKVRVTLFYPVADDTPVTLSSSDQTLAAFPPSLVVTKGHATGVAEFNGVAPGAFVVSASLAGTTAQTSGVVVAGLALSDMSVPNPMVGGTTGLGYVALNARTSADVVVTLASADRTIFKVPDSVTIPAFSESADFPVQAGVTGTSTITASRGTQSLSQTSAVSGTNALWSLWLSPGAVQVGRTSVLSVMLLDVATSDVTVTLTSSNPGVATVPGSATVLAGTSSVSVPLTGLASGSTSITATHGSEQLLTTLKVTTSNPVTLSCEPVAVGSSAGCNLYLASVTTTDTAVALTVDHPAVLDTPATVTIPAGMNNYGFVVQGSAAGPALLTATLGTSSSSWPITVQPPPSGPAVLSRVDAAPTRGSVGDPVTFYVFLSSARSSDTAVTLGSSNTAVVSLPATVVVPQGSTYVMVNATFAAPGYAIVTAGVASGAMATVVSATAVVPAPSLSGLSGKVEVGFVGAETIYASGAHGTTASFTLGTAAIVSLVGSGGSFSSGSSDVAWPADQTALTVPVKALAVGSTTISATLPGQPLGSTTVSVVAKASPTSVGLGGISVSTAGTLSVYLDALVAADTVATLSQTNTGGTIANLPTTVVIPTGQSYASILVKGQLQGQVVVTATVNGASVSSAATAIGP